MHNIPYFLLYQVYELIHVHSCLTKEAQTAQNPSPTVRHMASAQEQTHTEAKATSQNPSTPPPPSVHMKNDLLNIYRANASWGAQHIKNKINGLILSPSNQDKS